MKPKLSMNNQVVWSKNKKKQIVILCPHCKYELVTFKSEIETVACHELCPNCKQELDWSHEFKEK